MFRPSNFFTSLAEYVADLEDWWAGDGSWGDIRARRSRPPTSEFTPPDYTDRPFGMPPDVERNPWSKP